MPKTSTTQKEAIFFFTESLRAIECKESFAVEVLKILLNFISKNTNTETVAIFTEEALWFFDELGMQVASDFLPSLFIPFHIAQKIANEVRLVSHVTRSGTIEILQGLGYEVEEASSHDFHERNLSSNYREFSHREIARLTVKVFGEIARGVTVSSGPATEAVVLLRPLPCMPPVVIGETIGLEINSPPGNLKVPFGDCQC